MNLPGRQVDRCRGQKPGDEGDMDHQALVFKVFPRKQS